jgi:hypothetical protein
MPDDRDQFPGVRPLRGTSIAYILQRLEREDRSDLIDAIVTRKVSAFAVAVHLGWVQRPATLRDRESHQAKRRRYALARIGA